MRLALLLTAACLAISAPAAAQTPETPTRTFTARDLFGLRQATDPQVRPDGGAIAYVRVSNDIMTDRGRPSIWLMDPASGVQSPLVADDNANLHPRWSPDGQRLAYVTAAPGGPPQLYVRWMASGRSARVATLEQAPSEITWSPDGKLLAFTMLVPAPGRSLGAPLARPEGAKWAEPLKVIDQLTYRADGEGYLQPGHPQLFVVSADGGQPRQITFGPYDVG